MKHSYTIYDCDEAAPLSTDKVMSQFPNFFLENISFNFDDALDAVLECVPQLVFIRCKSTNVDGLRLIAEIHRYMNDTPQFIIVSEDVSISYQAIKYGVFDYILEPIAHREVRRCLLRFEKFESLRISNMKNGMSLPLTTALVNEQHTAELLLEQNEALLYNGGLLICIKSYGDYRYIEANSICYLKADNNSTDIQLQSGDVITAFKTLKTFEVSLPWPFLRIHNSYIINVNSIARIHTGTAFIYLKNGTAKIPFSKSYKSNVEQIIADFENKNYLEF